MRDVGKCGAAGTLWEEYQRKSRIEAEKLRVEADRRRSSIFMPYHKSDGVYILVGVATAVIIAVLFFFRYGM